MTVPDLLSEVQCEEVEIEPDLTELFADAWAELDELAAGCEPHAPGEPRLPFSEWLGVQAAYYRSLATPAALWLAALIQDRADLARTTHSLTPDDLDARTEVLEGGRDAALRRGGYDRAMRQVMGAAWHPAF